MKTGCKKIPLLGVNMTEKKSIALVTGAAGWLGLGLVNALSNGLPDHPDLAAPEKDLTIRCLVEPDQNTDLLRKIHTSLEIVEGDILRPETLTSFFDGAQGATLYHLVGIIHPKRLRDLKRVNTRGALNVYAAAAEAKVRRAVMVSSNSPCGNNPSNDHLFDESSPYHPYMTYGRSKMLMEQGVWKLHKEGNAPETVIVRPCWFYGPFQPPRQTEFFTMIRDGKGPLLGSGESLRSMSYIDNLAQGLLLAGKVPGIDGSTYWIADKRAYPMKEILDTIESLLRDEFSIPCKGKRLKLPSFAADFAGFVDFCMQAVGLYHQKVHVLSEMNKTIACSVEKAERELGYRPTVDLREGMRRSIAWLLEQPAENAKLVVGKESD
jgi:nucleoside-diphosphate-sugar epimerase